MGLYARLLGAEGTRFGMMSYKPIAPPSAVNASLTESAERKLEARET